MQVTPQHVKALSALGQVWVFLKYHHPAVAAGKYDWDDELIKEIPSVVAAQDTAAWQKELERWVDSFPKPEPDKLPEKPPVPADIKLQPDYGELFNPGFLRPSLATKLRYLLKNCRIKSNFYVSFPSGNGQAQFNNEIPYSGIPYPDANLRLLALCRYWGAVQYFYPYRYLTGENWGKVLADFIPVFMGARDSAEYLFACRLLIEKIHDSHAWIWKDNKIYFGDMGIYRPALRAVFVENKLVVDSVCRGFSGGMAAGDVITHIDGESVSERTKRMAAVVGASNEAARLRNIAGLILLGHTGSIQITVSHDSKSKTVSLSRYGPWLSKLLWNLFGSRSAKDGYRTIGADIGYLAPTPGMNSLPALRNVFKETKGIVVDMRGHASDLITFDFSAYLKSGVSPFAMFTFADAGRPGLFTFAKTVSNGTSLADHKGLNERYKGKVVVIVNEMTQSACEFETMALQSSPGVTVIGATTAGADGNISKLALPGGIETSFSGIGVYYPDKTETQRVGIKIDIPVRPTLEGIRAGRDEVLERAIEFIKRPNQKF